MQRVRSKHDSKKKNAFPTVQEEDDGDRASGSAFVVNVGDDQLVFDASKFKAKKRVSGQLTSGAIEILNKQPTERSEDELWRLQVRRCGDKCCHDSFCSSAFQQMGFTISSSSAPFPTFVGSRHFL